MSKQIDSLSKTKNSILIKLLILIATVYIAYHVLSGMFEGFLNAYKNGS